MIRQLGHSVHLVVPSKTGGGWEVEPRAGRSVSFVELHAQALHSISSGRAQNGGNSSGIVHDDETISRSPTWLALQLRPWRRAGSGRDGEPVATDSGGGSGERWAE